MSVPSAFFPATTPTPTSWTPARVIAAARARRGRGAGGVTVDKANAKTVIDTGARFITGGNEWSFLQEAARAGGRVARTAARLSGRGAGPCPPRAARNSP